VARSSRERPITKVWAVALMCCLALIGLLSSTVRAQSPTPSPSATPSAPPTDLRLEQPVNATNPDGSFIPPERREAVSSLTWSAVPGFVGAYVLERSRAPYGSTESRQWEALAQVAGTWFVEEPYPFLDLLAYQRCYRVAALVDGHAGPYSNEVCTVPPPSTGPEPAAEPPFNFDEVREVVVPLIGDDGRTHYVTLSEDTAGIVRIRLSLFNFEAGPYHTVLFRGGSCASTPGSAPGETLRRDHRFTLERDAATTLVLTFFNTADITLTAGPKSIYGPAPTFLILFSTRPDGTELRVACAALSAPPGPPDTGTGAGTNTGAVTSLGSRILVVSAVLVSLAGATALTALRRRL